MTYGEKLQDARWKIRRSQVIIRDESKCAIKGCSNTNIQVHHTDYIADKEPWEYPDEMLVSLCDQHHADQSYRFEYEEDLIQSIRLNGLLAQDILALSTLLHIDPKFRAMLINTVRIFSKDY